jgi:hypothetical protein
MKTCCPSSLTRNSTVPAFAVAHGAAEAHRVLAQAIAEPRVQVRCGRYLQHLLVTPLHRAVALEEVDHLSRVVGENLDLDVPGSAQGLLQKHRPVPEGPFGLAHRGLDGARKVLRSLDPPETSPSPASGGLHEDRVTYPFGGGEGLFCILDRFRSAQHGDPGLFSGAASAHLVSGQREHLRRRADKHYSGLGARPGKSSALREKPVAGVDRVGFDSERRLD